VLNRHQWAIGLMESRCAPGPATLRHHALLDSFVYGFAVQEASPPFDSPEDAGNSLTTYLVRPQPESIPTLRSWPPERAMQADYDFGDEFKVGLDQLLDSLDRAIER
jgi:hypothetical protein